MTIFELICFLLLRNGGAEPLLHDGELFCPVHGLVFFAALLQVLMDGWVHKGRMGWCIDTITAESEILWLH